VRSRVTRPCKKRVTLEERCGIKTLYSFLKYSATVRSRLTQK
jgi:hypothetical protein